MIPAKTKDATIITSVYTFRWTNGNLVDETMLMKYIMYKVILVQVFQRYNSDKKITVQSRSLVLLPQYSRNHFLNVRSSF